MSKRESILHAMETLLWERGYEATSPRLVLERSGAGQGSLYHHFRGKKQLAIEAMEEHEAELVGQAVAILGDSAEEPLARLRRWLQGPREALSGCRLGRFVNEKTVREDDELRQPVARYFARLHTLLRDLLAELLDGHQRAGYQGAGTVSTLGTVGTVVGPEELASMLIAVVQGGFVLSQATNDPTHMEKATQAALGLLNSFLVPPDGGGGHA